MPKKLSIWWVLLFLSTLVVIWRMVDFIDEAVHGEFHMIYFGVVLAGSGAGVVQAAIVVGGITLVWMAGARLFRL